MIGDNGEAYGVVSMDTARQMARDAGLDLVEVSPSAKPPVIKLSDYGKFKYNQQKKANEAKKKQVVVHLKQIQYRPNIETHDMVTKLNHAKKFLEQGDKVKMVMQFRGREMAYKEAGLEKFKQIVAGVVELGAAVEAEPKFMGNRVIAILAPDKKAMKIAAKKKAQVAKATSQVDTQEAKA